jgi:hypothetical protein
LIRSSAFVASATASQAFSPACAASGSSFERFARSNSVRAR